MKLYVPFLVALMAAPAFAQEATDNADGSTAADVDTEMEARVGTTFFSDEGMTTMRTAEEIQTNWATLSAEDQAALRARCEAVMQASVKMEPSKGDATAAGGPTEGTGADTDAAEGGSDATDPNDSTGTTTAEDMGFMGDDARMRPICDIVATY